MSTQPEIAQELDATIRRYASGVIDTTTARQDLRALLQTFAGIPVNRSHSFADIFKAIANHPENISNPHLAAITILLISTPDLLPATLRETAGRHVLRIIEQGHPRLLSDYDIPKSAQTYQRYDALTRIHFSACEHLQPFCQPFSALHDLCARRQMLMRSLNHGPTKSYLNPLGLQQVSSSLQSILGLAEKTLSSQDHLLQNNLQNLSETLEDELETYQSLNIFIVQNYFLPLLNNLDLAIKSFQAAMADRFSCTISPPSLSFEMEKKYPLHISSTTIEVHVPLTNSGPGTAQNVRALCIADDCDVYSDDTHLGAIDPGTFVLPIVAQVTNPVESLEFQIALDWEVVGIPTTQTIAFTLKISCQRTDLDWPTLARLQPYSLEVAYDTDFYGRRDALDRILHRLDPASMQSCYITGQKRVGKSSLAHAVEARVGARVREGLYDDYSVLYLECGEIRHLTGTATMAELGQQIEAFVLDLLPRHMTWKEQSYSSSLIPLGRLFTLLGKEKPNARVLIIFDEFDDINEELYRYGDLANTFFLNIRTLASRKNLAFLLVGAERMPYVMSAQGEKLNKFQGESLNSFDLSTEWTDYRSLIENPLRESVTVYETAVRKLFEYTNGHPYFTKVICTTVFERAVRFRDAEVSATEVVKAAEQVITDLDVNAFAHYWRDGIRGGEEEEEIISLKRCRALVAWARATRVGRLTSHDTVVEHLYTGLLPTSDVLPLLEDFVRRDVFRMCGNTYSTTVKLFDEWLREGGFSRLISDQLGDELADARQKREDEAYVQATEIVELVERWDLYQGRQITTDDVRAWLDQVDSNQQRRLLFKALQNVCFVGEAEVREKWRQAYRRIRDKLPPFTRRARAQRREDILVTYADGPGKSGAYYAGIYAAANEISTACVVEPGKVEQVASAERNEAVRGVVLVDDMVGTGRNLVERLAQWAEAFAAVGVGRTIPLSVVVLYGTPVGEARVREHLEAIGPNAELEVCEVLEPTQFAFGQSTGFWDSEDEKARARALFVEIGARVQRRTPLGYGDQGLLLTFARNCPNNSLPILHATGRGERKWSPIFPRSKA